MMNKKTTDIVAYLTWVGLLVAFVAGDRRGGQVPFEPVPGDLAGGHPGRRGRAVAGLAAPGGMAGGPGPGPVRPVLRGPAGSSASSTPSGAWRSRCPCWAASICCIENRRGEARRASPLLFIIFPGNISPRRAHAPPETPGPGGTPGSRRRWGSRSGGSSCTGPAGSPHTAGSPLPGRTCRPPGGGGPRRRRRPGSGGSGR